MSKPFPKFIKNYKFVIFFYKVTLGIDFVFPNTTQLSLLAHTQIHFFPHFMSGLALREGQSTFMRVASRGRERRRWIWKVWKRKWAGEYKRGDKFERKRNGRCSWKKCVLTQKKKNPLFSKYCGLTNKCVLTILSGVLI